METVAQFAASNGVKLHPELAGVIVGSPWALSTICKAFGFKNPCADGKVYLTPTKLAQLGDLPVAEASR